MTARGRALQHLPQVEALPFLWQSADSHAVLALRTLRVVRVLRGIKLIKKAPMMRSLIEVLMNSFSAVANFFALLLLVIYIYALLGMSLFGE